MRIGIVTNAKAPYRKLQFEEIGKKYKLKVYYTERKLIGRNWNVENLDGIEEVALPVIKNFGKYGNLNRKLLNVIKENDYILLGGYEHPSYIILSVICRLYKKPYFLIHDGVSPLKIGKERSKSKYLLKRLVIKNASGFFTNGTVGKEYFLKNFKIKEEKIFNQFLTVDIEKIQSFDSSKNIIKKTLKNKYQIKADKKVIIYSGRLIKRKNVDTIIQAISLLENKNDYVLVILGDGEEKDYLVKLANKLDVNINILGFIREQVELYQHYYIGDVLILPSNNEVWGLVINEGMAAGLPVIVSNECGCVKDLVIENYNGYTFRPKDIKDLAAKIELVLSEGKNKILGLNSRKIIQKWNVKNSAENFSKMLKSLLK